MEGDWEVEIGGGAPIIDACWPGLIHLQTAPERAAELSEAANLPGLAEALARLNGSHSPIWTSKCDVWPILDATDIDADELDAPQEEATFAWACYIDLLPHNGCHDPGALKGRNSGNASDSKGQNPSDAGSLKGRGFSPAETTISDDGALAPEGIPTEAARLIDAAAQWCQQLRAVPLTHCRADLIMRQAVIAPDQIDHGITAYLTACGRTSEEANAALARTLQAFAHTLCPDSTVEQVPSDFRQR